MKFKLPVNLPKEYIAKIIIEVFSVVFAVLLALGLNQWRETRADKKLGIRAISNITQEISVNKEKLTKILPVHDSILNLLNVAIESIENNQDFHMKLDNLQMEILSTTAWEAVKATESINLIDINYIIELSEMYDIQGLYMKTVYEFINNQDLMSLMNSNDSERILKTLDIHFSQLTNLGAQLQKKYDKTLQKLKEPV